MKKKWWVITALLGFVALALVILCIILFHAPSKSVVTNPETKPTIQPEDSKQTPINTAYFTMRLPAGFTIKSQSENATPQDIFQMVATKRNANGQQIAINLASLSSEGLSGVPSYNLRVKDTATYTPIEFGGMPAGIPTFCSQSSALYEVTGFWKQGSLYASISVSGAPNDKTNSNKIYTQVLESWQWR